MLYTIVYYIFMPLFKILYRFSTSGKENLPGSGRMILAANHISYLDPIVVSLAVYPRRVNFMAKEELFQVPILRNLITWLNAFPVRRGELDKKSLKRAISLLYQEKVLGVFPEGTRIKEGLGEAYRGAAFIALKTESPIIPIAISGTERVLPGKSIIPRFPKIRATIGKPIIPTEISHLDKKEKLKTMMDKVMFSLSEMLGS